MMPVMLFALVGFQAYVFVPYIYEQMIRLFHNKSKHVDVRRP